MSQTNLALTRLQIMNEGLGKAGRPDLLSEARLWLNLFLEAQYLNQDYEWLVKRIDSRAMVEGDTLPSDYVRMKNLTVTPQRLPMQLVEEDQYENLLRGYVNVSASNYGTPRYAYIDQNLALIHFVPVPFPAGPSQLVYNYGYYYFPSLPEVADNAHDSDVPKWGLSNDILVQEIYTKALNWNDDERYGPEKEDVKKMLNDSKMNSRDLRAGSPRFKLGKCHRGNRF